MLVLITYDVNTSDAAGRGRLRRIAKECVNYGQRVQNSVFECLLDTAQCRKLQNELCKIIDPEKDSLRFYYLGKKYENKIEHFGCKQTYLPEEPMILYCEAQARRDHLGGSHPKSAWFSCIKKEQNALTGGILCKSI